MSPQALSDMNVIEAECTLISLESPLRQSRFSVGEKIAAIAMGFTMPIFIPLTISAIADHNIVPAVITGLYTTLSLTVLTHILIRGSKSTHTSKQAADQSIKFSRVSPMPEYGPVPTPHMPPAQERPFVFTSHGIERLCEFLGYPPEALGDLKRAVEAADYSSEQVKYWVLLMSQSQYYDPNLDRAGDNFSGKKQTKRFKKIMKRWYRDPVVENSVTVSAGPRFWSQLFGGVVDELLTQSGSRSSSNGPTNHLGLLLSASDPSDGRTEYVKDSRRQVVGSVYNQNGWIYYKDERYQVLATKRYQKQANGSIDYRHYEIRDSRGQMISYR